MGSHSNLLKPRLGADTADRTGRYDSSVIRVSLFLFAAPPIAIAATAETDHACSMLPWPEWGAWLDGP